MRESQAYVNAYLRKLSFVTASFSRVRNVTNTFTTCKDKGQTTVGTQKQSPQEVGVNKM